MNKTCAWLKLGSSAVLQVTAFMFVCTLQYALLTYGGGIDRDVVIFWVGLIEVSFFALGLGLMLVGELLAIELARRELEDYWQPLEGDISATGAVLTLQV